MTDAESAIAIFDMAVRNVCRALKITPLDFATEYFASLGVVVLPFDLAERIEDIRQRLDSGEVRVSEITDVTDAVRALPGWAENQARGRLN